LCVCVILRFEASSDIRTFYKKLRHMTKRHLGILMLLAIFAIMACKKCTPKIENINPGPPGDLPIQLQGFILADLIERLNFGSCEFPNIFTADVEIIVRSATLDNNGMIVPTIDPYFEMEFEDQAFGNGNSIFPISVPSTGAYLLEIVIKTEICNNCCKDRNFSLQQNSSPTNDPRCDGDILNNVCPLGKPVLAYTKLFALEDRPVHLEGQNWTPNSSDFSLRNCRGCATCPTSNCQ
jgi:hypothetical protein